MTALCLRKVAQTSRFVSVFLGTLQNASSDTFGASCDLCDIGNFRDCPHHSESVLRTKRSSCHNYKFCFCFLTYFSLAGRSIPLVVTTLVNF